MKTKKLIAILSAMATTLSVAAVSSTAITMAEETKDSRVMGTETESEIFNIAASITVDTDGYEEETADTQIAIESEKEKTPLNIKLEDTKKAEKQIRLAEASLTKNIKQLKIDVGNTSSGNAERNIEIAEDKTSVGTDFPFTAVSYSSNEDALWDFCKSIGFTDAGAAAVLGNLSMESGLNPSSRTRNFDFKNGKGGGGLASWMCSGRFKNLAAFAEKKGASWQNLDVQMAFLQYEMDNTRRDVGAKMRTETDVDTATDYFCVNFEGCIGRSLSPHIDGISEINGKWYQGLSKRKSLARTYYARHAGAGNQN